MKNKFSKKIKIGSKIVSENSPVFIIGEIGSNHNLSMKTAKALIDVGARAGLDAVKFQFLKFDELYLPGRQTKHLQELHKKIDLPESCFAELSSYAKKRGLIFLSSPTYFKAVDLLEKLNVPAYKVASPITVGYGSLLVKIAKTKKPLIVSSGYCTMREIDRAMRLVLKTGNKKIILLHCVSGYPTLPHDVNLRFMKTLQKRYNCIVGFSDHTLSVSNPAVAAVLGARVIEKHYTLSRKLKGPDHRFALELDELAAMVKNIREAEQILGQGKNRKILPAEKKMKEIVMMKLVAARDIPAGTILKKEYIVFLRSPGGIEEFRVDKFIGRMVTKRIKKMTLIRAVNFK